MRTAPGASALLALLCLASPASALGWLDAPRDRAFAGPPPDAALAFLREQPGHADLDLETTATLRAPVGVTVRLQQRWRGLPVLGAQAAVRVLPGGRVSAATSTLAPRLALDTVEPALTQADAMALVGSLVGRSPAQPPRLAVLPEADVPGGGWLVWEATARGARGGERLVIDARSGRVRDRKLLDRTVKGRVYETSVLKTPTPIDVDLLDLDAATPQTLTGLNGQLSVYQYVSGNEQQGYEGEQSIAPDANGDFLYDPPADGSSTTDEFAVVNSYYHVHRIRQFYTTELGVDMTKSSWRLGVVANLLDDGKGVNNAFFAPGGLVSPSLPNMIGIGQGNVDFAYDSDVFIHEFTHYVSDNAIGYNQGQFGTDTFGVSPFGGSIDEGISDFFACTVNGDPILGEAALGPYARDLSAPSTTCPDGLTGEVHEDGKIIGQAAWAIRGLLGQALADQVIWGGFSLLEKGTSLQDFATAVLATTDDLVGAGTLTAAQRAQVAQEFASRGLDDCDRVLSLNKGARLSTMFGLGTLGQYFGVGCNQLKDQVSLTSSFHFSYKPEPGAKRIRFEVAMSPQGFGGSDDLDWDIYVRKNKTVFFKQSGYFPEVFNYDYSATGFYDYTGEMVIGEGTEIPLDPEATYNVVLVHRNCPYTQVTVEAFSDQVVPPPQGGAGGAAGAGGAGGAGKGGSSGKAGSAGKAGSTSRAGAAGVGGASSLDGPGTEAVDSPEVGGGCQSSSGPLPGVGAGGLGAVLGLAALLRRRAPARPVRRLSARCAAPGSYDARGSSAPRAPGVARGAAGSLRSEQTATALTTASPGPSGPPP